MSDLSDAQEDFLGEVIEARTDRFTAQCPKCRLHSPPAFGSFVKIPPSRQSVRPTPTQSELEADIDPFADGFFDGKWAGETPAPLDSLEGTSFALVYFATTGSFDFGRRASAYEISEDDLMAQQPQIYELLSTEFTAIPVGYALSGRFRSGVPPRPPRLHARVAACSPHEIITLTDSPDFLRLMVKAQLEVNSDELIISTLETAWLARNRDWQFLVRMGKQLATLLNREPDRLNALLDRLSGLTGEV